MRPLADYDLTEWLTGAPLAQRLRRARNRLVDQVYRGRKAPGQEALVARLAHHDGAMAFTIAFNMPEAVELLVDAMVRFVPATPLVVCDNSNDAVARAALLALCAARGIAYCPLPPSPYSGGRNGSRSHAVALNWVFHNLIRPAAPKVFALLDHDLVPLAPMDLAARVEKTPCYGFVRTAEPARSEKGGAPWYLWPGYSVFDFAGVADLPLDFGTDTPLGLDTGGQNWTVLYRHLDRAAAEAPARPVWITDPASGEKQSHLLVDSWLHAGGAGHAGRDGFAAVRTAYEHDPEGLLARLTGVAADGEPQKA